jgi:hypothetical protein
MKGVNVPFSDVGKMPAEQIYAEAKKLFLNAGGGDCLYLLGAGWDCLAAIAPLERDLDTVVLTNVPADVWASFNICASTNRSRDSDGCSQSCREKSLEKHLTVARFMSLIGGTFVVMAFLIVTCLG